MFGKISISACLLWVLAGGAAAQSVATGEFHVRVLDASGGGIGKASITITNRDNGWKETYVTDELGQFLVLQLRPGTYDVVAAANNFQAKTQTVPLAVGQRRPVYFSLDVGPAAPETINVTANPEVTEPDRTHQSSMIDQNTLRNLAIDRRDYLTITLLAPGVSDAEALADSTDYRVVQAAHSGISFHGNNGRGTSVTIDGAEANDSGGGVRPNLNQEAVAEFQINRTNYSAEFGGSSGGVLNIVSKSGSNIWGSTAYAFLRTQGLDAADPFARHFTGGRLERVKPDSNRQQFGASIGGPIARNRTFVFASFEGLERDEANSVAVLTSESIFAPTPQQETVLSGLQPADASRLRALLTSSATTRELFAINSGIFPFKTSDYKFSTRFDHLAGDNQYFFRYSSADIDESSPNTRALIGASRSFDTSRLDHTALVNWTHFISQGTINQVHYQYNYGTFRVSTAEKFGPQIDIQGFGFFNRDVLLPSNIRWRRHEITNRMVLTRGAHQLKIGGQLLLRDNHVESHSFLAGRFIFGPRAGIMADPLLAGTTLTALQAFDLGLPEAYQQGFGDPVVFSTEPYLGLFVQDLWKLRENFTLDFGLRYELDDVRDPIRTDTNNLAPRIGIAWDPWNDKKSTVRAAYGIFYAPTSYALPVTIAQLGENNGSRQIAQVLSTLAFPGPTSVAGPINIFDKLREQGVITLPTPTQSLQESHLSQFGINITHTGPRPPGTVLFRASDDFASSYTQQASFGVERDFGDQFLVAANYLFVRGLKIMRARDVNLLPAPVSPALGVRVWGPGYFRDPALLQENVYESTGNSFYHGATLEITKRLSGNIRINANYTLSKAIDEVTDYNSDFQANDQTNLRAERSLSSFDQRHKLVAWAFVETGPRRGNGVLSHVLADLMLSPILRFNSGRPFNLLVGSETNQDRHSTTDRPPGAGRNTGTGPSFWSVDVRLARTISLRERTSVEIIGEAFNALNKLNYRSVNNTVGMMAPPFDVRGDEDRGPSEPLGFTSAFEPRRIQLGVRLSF